MENQIIASEEMVNEETGEITPVVLQSNVVRETNEYVVIRKPDGKFERKTKYKRFATHIPQTDEEKIELYSVLNDSNCDLVTEMKHCIGEEIIITNIFLNPYEKFNEDTGDSDFGVTSCIQTDDGRYIVTSSKSVYFSLINMLKAFEKGILGMKVEIVGIKREKGIQIDISLRK